jgi:hypothetical protein
VRVGPPPALCRASSVVQNTRAVFCILQHIQGELHLRLCLGRLTFAATMVLQAVSGTKKSGRCSDRGGKGAHGQQFHGVSALKTTERELGARICGINVGKGGRAEPILVS